MSLEDSLRQIASFSGTFSLKLIVFLFLICSIGEFGASVPYLLETVWLLSGYHLGTGVLSPLELALLWLVAQAGRQTGAATLYYLSQFGSMPLRKLYQRFSPASLSKKLSGNSDALPFKFLYKINYQSPFSIAFGRLLWLRIPLTFTLGARRKLAILSPAVLLSSLVWDGIYISLGVIGGAIVVLKPINMVLYSLSGLTLLYVTTFAIRRVLWRRHS